MATFIIFQRVKTTDQAELDAYSPLARASFSGHDVTLHVAYGSQKILEGAQTEGTVIVSFPTQEAAVAWYDSDAYRAARAVRMRGAEYNVIMVDGISSP